MTETDLETTQPRQPPRKTPRGSVTPRAVDRSAARLNPSRTQMKEGRGAASSSFARVCDTPSGNARPGCCDISPRRRPDGRIKSRNFMNIYMRKTESFAKASGEQALRRRLENSEPPIGVRIFCISFGPNTHTAFLFPSPPKKNKPRMRGGNAFPRSPVSGPGGRRGSEWSSRCRRCLSERARRSRGHFPVVRSRRDPASGPLARVRDLAATLVQFGGDATHPASSARVSC